MTWNANNTVWNPISPGAAANSYHMLSHQGNGKWRMVPAGLGDSVESDGGSEDYQPGTMFILWETGEFYKAESFEGSDSREWRWNGSAWVEGDYGARYNNDHYYPYLEFTFSGNGPQRIYVGYAGYGTGYDSDSSGENAYNTSTIVSNSVAGTPFPFSSPFPGGFSNSFYIDIPEVNPDNPASSGGTSSGGTSSSGSPSGSAARYFQSSGPIGLNEIKTFIDKEYYKPGAIAVNGYYPLFTTESASNSCVGGDGSSHTHSLNGITYYMPNGLTMGTNQFHGDLPTVSYSNISLGTMFSEAQSLTPQPAALPNGNFTAPHSMSEFYDAYIQMSSIEITSIEETSPPTTLIGGAAGVPNINQEGNCRNNYGGQYTNALSMPLSYEGSYFVPAGRENVKFGATGSGKIQGHFAFHGKAKHGSSDGVSSHVYSVIGAGLQWRNAIGNITLNGNSVGFDPSHVSSVMPYDDSETPYPNANYSTSFYGPAPATINGSTNRFELDVDYQASGGNLAITNGLNVLLPCRWQWGYDDNETSAWEELYTHWQFRITEHSFLPSAPTTETMAVTPIKGSGGILPVPAGVLNVNTSTLYHAPYKIKFGLSYVRVSGDYYGGNSFHLTHSLNGTITLNGQTIDLSTVGWGPGGPEYTVNNMSFSTTPSSYPNYQAITSFTITESDYSVSQPSKVITVNWQEEEEDDEDGSTYMENYSSNLRIFLDFWVTEVTYTTG